MKRPLRLTTFALAAVLVSRSAVAHPLSTTSVTIAHGTGDTLKVALVIDAAALIAKLDTDRPLDTSAMESSTPAAVRARILDLCHELVRTVHLSVNGRGLTLSANDVRVDAQQNATVTFDAPASGPTTKLVWQTSLTTGTYALSVESADGTSTLQWIAGTTPSEPVSMVTTDFVHTIGRGIVLGFTHIVPRGVDHILFVIGLALFGARGRQLLLLVTAFTVAHSITLGLGLYGVVAAPSRVVEPLIALSVAYVGLENVLGGRHLRWRAAVVFAFGLLHGLGFASALAELTHSAATRLATLAAFNVGVECGQVTVLAGTLGLLALVRLLRAGGDLRVARLGSAAVGLMGAVWTVERIFGG